MSTVNMILKIKVVVYAFKILTFFLLRRTFGNIIYDIATKHAEELTIAELRKLEKLCIKSKRAECDINFFNNYKRLDVVPKFLTFNLPHTNRVDAKSIRKKLLKSATKRRIDDKQKLDVERDNVEKKVRGILTGLEWYLLNKALQKNINKEVDNIVTTHQKKLENLTKNNMLPFTHEEVVNNLSSVNLTSEELELLKYGMDYAIPPSRISKTDIFTQFEMIHRLISKDITDNEKKSELRTVMSHLAVSYYNSYSPSKSSLKKHGIIKKLRGNKNIVIVKPDKGNGIVILDRGVYNNRIYEIINDGTKFKKLKEDETLKRQGSLQRFLLSLKKGGFFSKEDYERIYPTGSMPARLYGNPKMHKVKEPGVIPPMRPIVSSIGSYKYNLAKFLGNELTPHI